VPVPCPAGRAHLADADALGEARGFPLARCVASSAPAHPKKVRVETETTTWLNARYRELAGGRRRAARAKAHRNHTVRPVRGIGVDGSHCGALRLAREAEKDLRGRKFTLANVKSMIDGQVTCDKMPMDGWGEPKRCPAFPRNCSTSFSSRCFSELHSRHWSPEGLRLLFCSFPRPGRMLFLICLPGHLPSGSREA